MRALPTTGLVLALAACGGAATATDAGRDGDSRDAATDARVGYTTNFDGVLARRPVRLARRLRLHELHRDARAVTTAHRDATTAT